jgi:uncharacterized protein (TIGR04255 family)
MTNTLLPIRISPHALLAALVAVSYTPRNDSAQTREEFRQVLKQAGFTDESELLAALGNEIGKPEALFRGQGVSIHLQANSIVFNGIEGKKVDSNANAEYNDEYIGWSRYFPILQQVLSLLHSTGAVTDFSHTAVRYINALPNLPLNEQLQVKMPSLGNLPLPSSTLYRATFTDVRVIESGQTFEVELSLADQQRVAGRTGKQSVFDVTVRANTTGLDLSTIFQRLSDAHTCEKQVFFGLLDSDYLESLNPVYIQ